LPGASGRGILPPVSIPSYSPRAAAGLALVLASVGSALALSAGESVVAAGEAGATFRVYFAGFPVLAVWHSVVGDAVAWSRAWASVTGAGWGLLGTALFAAASAFAGRPPRLSVRGRPAPAQNNSESDHFALPSQDR
jgi:hypothetical protein